MTLPGIYDLQYKGVLIYSKNRHGHRPVPELPLAILLAIEILKKVKNSEFFIVCRLNDAVDTICDQR